MSWDDGKHTKVKKVKLTFDDVIKSIEVEYHGTNLKSQPRGTIGSKTDEFTLSPDEYITEVTGYSKNTFSGEVITALTFKTNKNTFGPYGNKTRDYFSVTAPKDNQIAGFLGSSSNALNSIDVHFAPIPPAGSIGGDTTVNPGGSGSYPGNTNTNPGGTGANPGGTGGPGSNPGGAGGSGANPGGTGGPGANPGGPGAKPEGPGGPGTNPGGTNPGGPGAKPEGPGGPGANPGGTGGPGANPGANPGGSGAKPGSTETNTDSNPQKVEAQGVKGGTQWDDGSDHDSVTKIHIAPGGSGIEQIKFDYVKNGETKEGSAHGVKGRSLVSTFEISHPNEYLISAKFWFNSSTSKIIQGIQFKTNTKTSDYFGYEFSGDGTQVTLEVKDKKIVGFHGFTDTHLSSLGAYFVPITSTSLKPATGKKLNAVGGEEGVLWDDGVFDGVRKVYVGQYHDGVSFVKIEYNKGSEVIIGDGHGKKSMLGVEPFELDYPSEYITAIGVYYDNVHGDKGGTTIVTSLIFKTNKQTSQPFGLEGGEYVELKEEGHKIVGFHGKAGDYVHQIGVYVTPITN